MQDNRNNSQHIDKSVISAAYISLGTLSSRILGLLRDALLGAYFSRTITDAWLVAFRVPNMFRRIFGEGALSISFIPVFIGLMVDPKSKENQEDLRLMRGLFSLLCLLLLVVTLLGIIFADKIIFLLAGTSSFLSIPGKFALTVQMAKIMFCFCFFICLYAYFAAILNAFKKFVWAAFAPVLFNITMITAIFCAKETPLILAYGVAVGGFLQMAILLPVLFKEKVFLSFSKNILSPHVLLVLKKMLPGILSLGILQLGVMINTHFASSLQEGANSWLYWADRVLELPLSLFAVSLGTATLPTLSHHWSQQEKNEMLLANNKYLRTVFLFAIPCFVGLWVLHWPIVEVLFYRGKFDQSDLANTALVLKIYSFGVLSFAGIRILATSFYAVQNTLFPALVTAVCLFIHFFLAQVLMKSNGIAGLASSSMICAGLNFLILLMGFRIKIGPLYAFQFFKSFWKYSVSAAIMYGVLFEMQKIMMNKTIGLFVMILAGALTYFAVVWLLTNRSLRVFRIS